MTNTQELLEQSFEINLNNYGPEDVERLNDWAIKAYAALEALQAEIERLTIDRRVLQADGNHPAPCAKFCEATAFTIELRRAQAEIKVQTRAADHWMAEANKSHNLTVTQQAENAQWLVDFKEMVIARDAALARLAEIERQEPIYQYQCADDSWIDQTKNSYDYNVRYGAATVRILFAAAGASPVEPSQALELSDDEIDALLPTITLKGLDPKQQVWLTKKDAIAFARAIIAAINAKERAAHGIKQGGQQ